MNLDRFFDPPASKKLRCVVRVYTSCYPTKRGFNYTKKVECMKRKSQLRLDDFLGDIDLECLPLNLFEVEDGLYTLETINESTCWETGYLEDWDVKLRPYTEAS